MLVAHHDGHDGRGPQKTTPGAIGRGPAGSVPLVVLRTVLVAELALRGAAGPRGRVPAGHRVVLLAVAVAAPLVGPVAALLGDAASIGRPVVTR